MAAPAKQATVSVLTESFRGSRAIFLTEYRGLTVGDLREFRRSLASEARCVVAKNTLARIAAKNAGILGLDDQLLGPTALVIVHGDAVAAAKVLKNFAKTNPSLFTKGGYFDGSVLNANDVEKLASLESREVLLAKTAGVAKASLYVAAYLLKAPLTRVARAFSALKDKQDS